MVKRWLTPPPRMTYVYGQDLTRNFFKDSNAHGQKMIDPPEWQTRISPRIFLKAHYVYGQKMDLNRNFF